MVVVPSLVMVSFDTAVTLTGSVWPSAGSFCAVTITVGTTIRSGGERLRLRMDRPRRRSTKANAKNSTTELQHHGRQTAASNQLSVHSVTCVQSP